MATHINRIVETFLPGPTAKSRQHPMVFLTGPRQVGKTVSTRRTKYPYFNWDTSEVKKAFLQDPYFFQGSDSWVIFDEIHKRRDWKKLMKGYFDSPKRRENFIVTGSGRFNLGQRGGDSLQGRYDLYHVMPIIYREFVGIKKNYKLDAPNFEQIEFRKTSIDISQLLRFGGFPEPLVRSEERFLNKWQDLYTQRLVYEDVRDFSRVGEIDKLELLARLLPSRVGSPMSHKSLAEDLEVSRDSIKSWINLFETLYFGFSLPPFSRKIHRAVKKEKKWYLFHWPFCEDSAARFENFIAVQLYSLCAMWRDAGLGIYELHYLRDQDRREIDFLITKNLKPLVLIEAKLSESHWASSLDYYASSMNLPSFIITAEPNQNRRIADRKWIVSAATFFDAIS